MKVLFMSKCGTSLGLVERVKREGHAAYLYTLEERAERVGQGIVDRTSTTGPVSNGSRNVVATNVDKLLRECSPDLVVFNGVGLGKVADYVRERGVPTLGACRWADSAQGDREYGHKLMGQVGIEYLLSEKEEEGVEVSCEFWWNGLQPLIPSVSFKERKFLTGGLGKDCGCVGCVVHTVPAACRLVEEGVGKMERLLKKTTYRGPISLSALATKVGLWGLSFTVGFSYNSLQALLEVYKGSVTQMLYSVASGGGEMGDFTSDYGAALLVSVPPYPYTDDPKCVGKGVPVLGVSEDNRRHIWWEDVERTKEGYVSVGVSGSLMSVVARGRYPEEAIKRMYRTAANLIVPEMQYRTDIGSRVKADENKLKQWDYL